MKKVKYIHNEAVHNMISPNIIVPLVMEIVAPKSVVDIGCGIGTWLKAFKDSGVTEVLGLDGEWCNKDLLYKYISKDEFICADLEKPIILDKSYDLVVSLEVAEHISEENVDIFVQSLVNAGKVILFSAAIPGQGGFNHINEQWASYWANKFQAYGYRFYDVIRHKIWNNPDVQAFYKQNMFIVTGENINIQAEDTVRDLVYPELYISKLKYIKNVERGKRGVSYYFPLLIKSIINKFKPD